DGLDLTLQEIGRRVVGGHADRYQRPIRGHPAGDRRRIDPVRHPYAGERRHRLATPLQLSLEVQLAGAVTAPIGDPRDPPEPASVAVKERIVRGTRVARHAGGRERVEAWMEGAKDVQARHAVRARRLWLAIDDEAEPADRRLPAEAPSADEQRRAGPDRQLG